MVSTFAIYEDLRQSLDPTAAEKIARYISAVYEELQQTAPKSDLAGLRAVVQDLAEAQKRTEQRVEELAEAQRRTEQRVEELAEAQRRTEQRVEELAEAQKRTEQRVEELAEAQRRTEERVTSLELAVERLARTQERGFHLFGLRLEALFSRSGSRAEVAFREGLREILREAGYTVECFQGVDPDGYINHDPGRTYELDILLRNGNVIAVEIKSSVGSPDIVRFFRAVGLYEQQTGRQISKRVMIAASIRPEARQRAEELGVKLGIDSGALDE